MPWALSVVGFLLAVDSTSAEPLPRVRPPSRQFPQNRTFVSPAVDARLAELEQRSWRDPDLFTLLWNCLPNTLDTTVKGHDGERDTFVVTGDIPAMWLRDSANQVTPYLGFATVEPKGIGALLRGVIRRHVNSVLLDSYANSFCEDSSDGNSTCACYPNCRSTHLDKDGNRVPANPKGVHERKWEMDSVISVLHLARNYWAHTKDAQPFDARWREAVRTIMQTLKTMQNPLLASNVSQAPYTYQTSTMEPKDTLAHGVGRAGRWTGMVRTHMLPSDDAARFPYHVPGNAYAVVELNETAALLRALSQPGDAELADELLELSGVIDAGIRKWGVVQRGSEEIYAMEVDGYGNYLFGDDANVPSLLSLPYLSYVAVDDARYLATRRLLLSNESNPYFWGPGMGGIEGIGSEDASGKVGWGHIWPISLMVRALTSTDDAEISEQLRQLKISSGGTGLMHESVWYLDTTQQTRAWFAWANSLFGTLMLRLIDERPHLIFTDMAI